MAKFVKIVLLGEPKSGKTYLVNQLNDIHYDTQEVYVPTVGVNSFQKEISRGFEEVVSVQFLDLPGKEMFEGLMAPYWSGANVFLICIDSEKHLDTSYIGDIIELIKNQLSDTSIETNKLSKDAKFSVHIVLTKSDLVQNDEDRKRVRQKATDLTNEFGLGSFFEISAKKDEKSDADNILMSVVESSLKAQARVIPVPTFNLVEIAERPLLKSKQKREEDRIQRIWDDARFPSENEKIVAILKQIYTKSNSRFFRIVNGCWARHHIKVVEALTVSKDKNGMSAADLVEALIDIKNNDPKFNPQGTLASIINFLNGKIVRDVDNSARPAIG